MCNAVPSPCDWTWACRSLQLHKNRHTKSGRCSRACTLQPVPLSSVLAAIIHKFVNCFRFSADFSCRYRKDLSCPIWRKQIRLARGRWVCLKSEDNLIFLMFCTGLLKRKSVWQRMCSAMPSASFATHLKTVRTLQLQHGGSIWSPCSLCCRSASTLSVWHSRGWTSAMDCGHGVLPAACTAAELEK